MCTRGLWLDQGHLIMDGTAADVAAAYAERYPVRRPTKPTPRPKAKPKQTRQPATETPARLETETPGNEKTDG